MSCEVEGCDRTAPEGKRVCWIHWFHIPYHLRVGWTKEATWEAALVHLNAMFAPKPKRKPRAF